MSIITKIKILVKPGNGGYGSLSSIIGCMSFDGGNGGSGGAIMLYRDDNKETLNHILKYKFCAENGVNGARNNQKGRMGKDMVISLSRQCIVSFLTINDYYLPYYELNEKNSKIVISGACGGKGSLSTKSAIYSLCTPKYSTEYLLEIRSLFDYNSVAIIFFPHLNACNNAIHEIFNIKLNSEFYIRYIRSHKIYIFPNYFKHLINSSKSFKLIIFTYSDSYNRVELEKLQAQIDSNILILNLEQLIYFLKNIS